MKMAKDKRGTTLHAVVRIALTVLVIYSAYCLLLYLFQRQLLFPRHQIERPSGVPQNGPNLERLWLDTSQGKVEAWFLPPALHDPAKPAPAIIFAHGNAELIDFWPQELRSFSSHGMGLLLVEYPGYGRSEGTPSQESISETLVVAYDTLVAREDVDPSRIVLFGRSLGGGAVLALADRRPSAALIVTSTFTSIKSFATKFLVPGFLVKDPFDNLTSIKSYSSPVLIVHGRHDSLIPYKHGVALYQAAPHAEMVTYDCSHNDCPPSWKILWQDVERFLRNVGIIEG
ncbi:MAG: alpha/beta hydrolase [Deltaproteobacteria bacterium]|nr:alpha/beta hydrolase [Deltaproteobacteria bacterium]